MGNLCTSNINVWAFDPSGIKLQKSSASRPPLIPKFGLISMCFLPLVLPSFMESYNHGIVELGKPLQDRRVQPLIQQFQGHHHGGKWDFEPFNVQLQPGMRREKNTHRDALHSCKMFWSSLNFEVLGCSFSSGAGEWKERGAGISWTFFQSLALILEQRREM